MDEDDNGIEQQNNNSNIEQQEEDDTNDTDTDNDEADEEHQQLVLQREVDAKYGPRTGAYGLRPCKKPSSSHMFKFNSYLNVMYDTIEDPTAHTILIQYSVNKGLKVFGERGANAVIVELQQLHDRRLMVPKNASKLTREEKKTALE